MKTGERFWQLISLTILILVGYALAEFSDAVDAKEKALQDQRVLLSKQEALVHDKQWDKNLATIEKLRQDWLEYLPVEPSPAVAKAHLLNELRSAALNAGITNAVVNATDSASVDQSSYNSTSTGNSDLGKQPTQQSSKTNTLPKDVHLTKADINGRFDPSAFNKLMQTLEERRFAVIERVDIRGTQITLNLRCYWHADTDVKTSEHKIGASLVKSHPDFE